MQQKSSFWHVWLSVVTLGTLIAMGIGYVLMQRNTDMRFAQIQESLEKLESKIVVNRSSEQGNTELTQLPQAFSMGGYMFDVPESWYPKEEKSPQLQRVEFYTRADERKTFSFTCPIGEFGLEAWEFTAESPRSFVKNGKAYLLSSDYGKGIVEYGVGDIMTARVGVKGGDEFKDCFFFADSPSDFSAFRAMLKTVR